MTVSTTSARVAYAGNGSTVTFTVPWYFLTSSDLRVIKRSSAGVETVLALTTHYTVAGAGVPAGGSITLGTAPATGETLTIIRDPVIVQNTDYLPNDPFPAESHERALDLGTMIDQRLDDRLDRALVLAESDTPGEGAYQAGNNRITNMAPGRLDSDAVTLLQVQALITTMGGGGSTGGGGGGNGTGIVVPDSEVTRIVGITLADPSLADMFTPLNQSVGNLSSQILALNNSVGSINTSVGTINVTMVDMQSQIDALSAISGDPANIILLISNEATARIDGDTATAAVIAKIGAAAGDNVSFILNTDTVKISSTETIGQRFSGIATQFGTVTSSVQSEATARSNADVAMAQTVAKLGAMNGAGTAFIIDLNTAYVGPTESLAQKFSGITTAVNNNTSAISTEQSTRANADSSLAVSITNLQSTVGGHTVTLSTQASTINGVQARYTVKIDNNGYVSGYGLISDSNTGTPVSTFRVLADRFEVYNGATATAPFEVVGGVVYIKEANIKTLTVGKLIAGGDTPFAPKAWARFYSTLGGSSAYFTRQSGFKSITRTAEGRYTFVFADASPMPNRLYTVLAMAANENQSTKGMIPTVYDVTTTSFKVSFINAFDNYKDTNLGQLIVFGSNDVTTAPPVGYDYTTDPTPPTWGPGGVIP